MRLWRVEEAQRLVESELAADLAEVWARCRGDFHCLEKTPYDSALVGVGRWWAGPFTIGNRKLGEMPFFSLPPVTTCPGHTPFCLRWCYAIYEVANWRAHVREAASYLLSQRDDFVDVVLSYLAKIPHPVVRLHVSGDFYSRAYLEKWAEAAGRRPDKIFYTYTKSLDLIRRVETPENLVIHISADPYNYVKAVETWRELGRGLITYVYTPGEDVGPIRYILENTGAVLLLFLNHVQHAPRDDPRKIRTQLRATLGPQARRVVFDPEEFSSGPQCVQCGVCWRTAKYFKDPPYRKTWGIDMRRSTS
ncbi:conserved hypothetical protein [Pyrobaculum islandicum DSM 4184]|uniref:Gene product 88 domain-containing protein n=1 Tax=Pyrobaculum islandicum (strain DSM 4184 / JCM 9189 / GEO3) TaxID=384616 RepID=A1RVF7_PYRIL|nr:hypothetical protein [Pyrobaculum islandicum]ABL88939.1 conserved hypothetical protein [Pyrobaculum islandicum DSM 4184]